MHKRRRIDRKGISDVVVTVLIILLAVIAISMVWVFVSSLLKRGGNVNSETITTSFSIPPESVFVTYDNNVSFNIKLSYGEKADAITVALTDINGNTKTIRRNMTIKQFEVGNVYISYKEHGLTANISGVSVTPLIQVNEKEQAGKTNVVYTIGKGDFRLDRCGDGFVNTSYEQCDSGTNNGARLLRGNIIYNNNGTYCSNDTTPGASASLITGESVNPGRIRDNSVLACSSVNVRGPYCGDSIIDSGTEQCDNGTLNNQHCGISPPLPYGIHNCVWCDNSCNKQYDIGTWCGDGILQASMEECDPVIGIGSKKCTNSGYLKGTGITCNTEGDPNQCKLNYANCQIPLSEIYGYWKFEESTLSGSGAVKDEKSANNGTAFNGVTISSSGKSGKALKLNTAGYIKMENDDIKNKLEDGFTVTAWIKIDSLRNGVSNLLIGNKKYLSNGFEIRFQKSSNKGILVFYSNDIGNQYSCDGNTEFNLDTWQHIAVSYNKIKYADGTTTKTYINGALVPPSVDWKCKGLIKNAANDLMIGSLNEGIDGYIDEVIFFNRALSDAEIQQIYQNT